MELVDQDIQLREITLADRQQLVLLANNIHVGQNLRDGFPHPYSLKDADKFIRHCMKLSPPEIFAIEWEATYVGNIGLHPGTDVYRKSAELGYFLGEPYWNKGIMTRSVNLICDYGFRNMDIVRIYSGVFDFNKASQRVLEKCGFTLEGISKKAVFKNGRFCDEYRYAKVKTE